MLKLNHKKKKNFKAVRGKKTQYVQKNKHKEDNRFLLKQDRWEDNAAAIFKALEEWDSWPRILCPIKYTSKWKQNIF